MALPAKKSVELFYDVLSPYAWVGFELMCRYEHKWNIDLHLKPCLIGGLMAGTENTPPGANRVKARYFFRDLHRLRNYYQIPMVVPKEFELTILKKGSLLAQRLLTATRLREPQHLENLSRALWLRVWSKDEDITQPDSLLEACRAAGVPEANSETLLDSIKDQQVKDELRLVTQKALDYGAFGVPTIILEGENNKKSMVFGSDRMPIIGMMLDEEYAGPLNELAKTSI